jgi:hypothetical protein
MGVEKMSVSFELELGEAIRSSAAGEGRSVSAWLAEAARDRLRLEALGDAVGAWEETFGPLTDAEVADADRLLDHPAKAVKKTRSPRRRGAA